MSTAALFPSKATLIIESRNGLSILSRIAVLIKSEEQYKRIV